MSDSTVTIAGIDLSLMIKIFLELKKKVSPRGDVIAAPIVQFRRLGYTIISVLSCIANDRLINKLWQIIVTLCRACIVDFVI